MFSVLYKILKWDGTNELQYNCKNIWMWIFVEEFLDQRSDSDKWGNLF